MRKGFVITWMLLVSAVLISNQLPLQLPEVVENVYSSVVYIEAGDDAGYWSGSGVVVDNRGIILTAGHVLEGTDFVEVHFSNGRVYEAVDWCVDPNDDVGIIQIIDFSDKLNAVELTKNAVLGEQVFLIGSPLGKSHFNSVSVGYLSGFDRIRSFFGVEPLFQFDGAANPGNSGCPAFNMQGEIVGILIGGWTFYEHMNYLVPAETCIRFIEEYIQERS